MRARLPIGISDYKELVTGDYIFADKSMFIKEIVEDGSKVILITRPRRFGKTLNLSMLSYFFNLEAKENLFQHSLIAADKEFCQNHQGKYPIIFISFKDIKASNFDEAYREIKSLISSLYMKHIDLLKDDLMNEHDKKVFNKILGKTSDQDEITESILKLSKHLNKKYGQNPIILMDEYDTPIQSAYFKGFYADMIELMRSIFGKALKDNTYFHKAVITGITRVAQEGMFSGLNNLKVYTSLSSKYGKYFGFTEEEVKVLINKTGNHVELESFRNWYNGYKMGGEYTVYNPWSTIYCLDEGGELGPYWLNTANQDLIRSLISNADQDVQEGFIKLLQRESIEVGLVEGLVFPEIHTNKEALWILLVYAGYLNVDSQKRVDADLLATVSIPNQEVACIYNSVIKKWFSKGGNASHYAAFIKSLISGELEKFKEFLSEYLKESTSFFDFNSKTPEQLFHVFILGLVAGLKQDYVIESNRESGKGRADIMMIPRDKSERGILIEFKVASEALKLKEKSLEALNQIKEKEYITRLKQEGVKQATLIGIAFYGKSVELSHLDLRISE